MARPVPAKVHFVVEMKKSGTAEALLFRLFCPCGQEKTKELFCALGELKSISQEVAL